MVVEEEKEKLSTKRWIVTYTKHMKQKRKVYHDGVLELCSLSGKPQIILYDDCEKVIDRRLFKKDEIVKSGGTLSYETHIVDIGDPDGNKRPTAKSNVKPVIQPETQKEKAESNVKSGIQPVTQKEKSESNVKSVIQPETHKEKLCVEWNVLYTTHMTQKVKTYHDGILRVLICSSHLNLITLLNEDGAILSSKYLKSVACLETGKNCEFPNYLVEICERRASAAGHEGYSDVCSLSKDFHKKDSMNQVLPSRPEKCDKLLTSRKDCKIPLCSVPNKETFGWRTSNARASSTLNNLPKDHSKKVRDNCNSKIGGFNNSSTAMLRDACQILSVLKKPSLEGGPVLWDPFVEQGLGSQSLDQCQHDLQESSEKIRPSACYSRQDSISAAHLVQDTDCEGISSENDCASLICSSGTVALNASPSKCTGGHTGLTAEASEVSVDPMLSGSSQINKPDQHIISDMKPIAPLQNHLSASTGSPLKENLDANERSSLHGMDTGLSDDSTLDQICAKGSQNDSSTMGASTSDAKKKTVIPTSVEDFPTFDLWL